MTQTYEWPNPWAEVVPQEPEVESSMSGLGLGEDAPRNSMDAVANPFERVEPGESPFASGESRFDETFATGETLRQEEDPPDHASAFEFPQLFEGRAVETGEGLSDAEAWRTENAPLEDRSATFGVNQNEDLFEAHALQQVESNADRWHSEGDLAGEASYGDSEHAGNCAEMLSESFEELEEHEDVFQGLTDLERKALMVVSTFETGRRGSFGGLVGNFDGQGISFGLMNWNIKSGGLAEMLKEFALSQSARFSAVFMPDAEQFKQVLLATRVGPDGRTRLRDVERQMAFVSSVMLDGKKNVNAHWRGHFGRLEQDPEFKSIQVKWAKKGLNSAWHWCGKLGFNTERGFAFLFDVVTQFGPGWLNSRQFRGARERLFADRLARKRAELGRELQEQDRMAVIAQMLVDLAKPEFKKIVRLRKMWFVDGGGKIYGSGGHVDLSRDFGITDRPIRPITAVPVIATSPSQSSSAATAPAQAVCSNPAAPVSLASGVSVGPPSVASAVSASPADTRTIRGRVVSQSGLGALEGAFVYVCSRRFATGRELPVFASADVKSAAITRLPPNTYGVLVPPSASGSTEFTKVRWSTVPGIPDGEGWICSRSGQERYASYVYQRPQTPSAVCDGSGAFSACVVGSDGEHKLRVVKAGFMDGELLVPPGRATEASTVALRPARTVAESEILKWLAVYRGYGYSLHNARYPKECFDINQRLGAPLNRDLSLSRTNSEKFTNCSTFTSGLLVSSWSSALGQQFRWTPKDHNNWNLAGEITEATRMQALNGPIEQGMGEPFQRVDISGRTSTVGAELNPTQWLLVQGFEKGLGGHSFIILDYDSETDMMLLLEANALGNGAAWKIEFNPPPSGPRLRALGHIDQYLPGTAGFPLGTGWRLQPRLTTWASLKACYRSRIVVRLFVNDLAWFV